MFLAPRGAWGEVNATGGTLVKFTARRHGFTKRLGFNPEATEFRLSPNTLLLLVGLGFFHGVARKAFQGPTYGG